jgi:hypothetical protein
MQVVGCGITRVAETVREKEEAGLDLWFSLLRMLWSARFRVENLQLDSWFLQLETVRIG